MSAQRLVNGKPAVQTTVRNGVRVTVRRTEKGSVVETSCGCMGHTFRTHTTTACPLFKTLTENRRVAGA